MHKPSINSNEQHAAIAFSRQSISFDHIYAGNSIVQYKRGRVRDRLLQWLAPGSHILELNAGTGDDAIYLAKEGHYVHATDIAEGMQQQLVEKVKRLQLDQRVSNELCSYTALDTLKNKGPYDCIFSNFAGLNCTGALGEVLDSFNALLKPGGLVVLVVLPPFCVWETALVFKGKFRTATRRFFSGNGRKAHIEGVFFKCWYYTPGFIKRRLLPGFQHLSTEGLCSFVPPSYIENFATKYPGLFSFLCKCENRYKATWPWRQIGDYYIISLRKKG